jgi:hypothetical protein
MVRFVDVPLQLTTAGDSQCVDQHQHHLHATEGAPMGPKPRVERDRTLK